ncbi:hypothetical protein F5878DRAFT_607904 [Lentinula raphanica]|uniref:Uncharacterized protein n=1 Tax=Lentinula raphanica TaxID=153919 RepID=A0AA38PGJ6_9AGAR|nr:hypothetical protein F5878DRAFT_607904 [Lentinula raphanica]
MGAQDAEQAVDEQRRLKQRSPEPSILNQKRLDSSVNSELKIVKDIEVDAALSQTIEVDQVESPRCEQDIPPGNVQSLEDTAAVPVDLLVEPVVPTCVKISGLLDLPPIPLIATYAKDSESTENRFDWFRKFKRQLTELPPSEILFKAGTLSYLWFVVKVIRRVWRMFDSQTLGFAFGHLALSMGTFAFIWYYSPGQVRAQYERTSFPPAVINLTIFIGAFICVSVSWSIVCIVRELVVLTLWPELLL